MPRRSLTFREKGLPKGLRHRAKILVLAFFISLIFFEIVLNYHHIPRQSMSMKGRLPVISVTSDGEEYSEMHGYLSEMNGCYMRESLIPLPKDRTITLNINAFSTNVSGASYELRSMDTSRKIEAKKIDDLTWPASGKGSEGSCDITLTNLVEPDEEYLLVVTLEYGRRNAGYYTRVMLPSNTRLDKCLSFAQKFSSTAMSGDATSISKYLEPDPDADQNTLSNVTISSSLSQVGWKGFDGGEAEHIVKSFTEIGDDYAGIQLNYQRTDKNDSVYNVEEYIKVRSTGSKYYLLDYERTMEEIPGGEFEISDNSLTLGIAKKDLHYISNDTGSICAFVQADELYEYNGNTGRMIKVFGFRDGDYEVHSNYRQHDIRLLDIDENGGLDFVVYGYMNGGSHEGYCGINLYRYQAGESIAKEEFFVATKKPFPILEAGFSELLYKSGSGEFYVMMDGTLTRVNARTGSDDEILTGMLGSQYAVSSSGRYIAWIDSVEADEYIHVMDLENESRFDLAPDDAGNLVRPMAFLQDNLVYGIVKSSDIGSDTAGNNLYPCCKLIIKDISSEDGAILKEYSKSGKYITSCDTSSYTITMQRVAKDGKTYKKISSDTIQDSSGEPNGTVELARTPSETKGLISSIVLDPSASLDETVGINVAAASLSPANIKAIATIDSSELHQRYYVYIGSRVIFASTNISDAINSADRKKGIVVDNEQRNIWKRTKKAYVSPYTSLGVGSTDTTASNQAKALSAILGKEGVSMDVSDALDSGSTPITVLSDGLKDKALVLDLTGAKLSQVLYYVGSGALVYAYTGSSDAVVINGYDSSGVYLYYPGSSETKRASLSDASKMFGDLGNVFISYYK